MARRWRILHREEATALRRRQIVRENLLRNHGARPHERSELGLGDEELVTLLHPGKPVPVVASAAPPAAAAAAAAASDARTLPPTPVAMVVDVGEGALEEPAAVARVPVAKTKPRRGKGASRSGVRPACHAVHVDSQIPVATGSGTTTPPRPRDTATTVTASAPVGLRAVLLRAFHVTPPTDGPAPGFTKLIPPLPPSLANISALLRLVTDARTGQPSRFVAAVDVRRRHHMPDIAPCDHASPAYNALLARVLSLFLWPFICAQLSATATVQQPTNPSAAAPVSLLSTGTRPVASPPVLIRSISASRSPASVAVVRTPSSQPAINLPTMLPYPPITPPAGPSPSAPACPVTASQTPPSLPAPIGGPGGPTLNLGDG